MMKRIIAMVVLCIFVFCACESRQTQPDDTPGGGSGVSDVTTVPPVTPSGSSDSSAPPPPEESGPPPTEVVVVDKPGSESSVAEGELEVFRPEGGDDGEPIDDGGAKVEGDNWLLLLVNKWNTMPKDYTPKLKVIQGNYKIDERVIADAKNMIETAKKEGIDLLVCSAYRSVESQTKLFNQKVEEYKNAGKNEEDAKAVAATIVAAPGTSEHNTGLAMDIVTPAYQNLDSGFEETDAFKWLDNNAAAYGFVLRFPKDKEETTGVIYEPWHYRYVGREHAQKIKTAGQCLEEYVKS